MSVTEEDERHGNRAGTLSGQSGKRALFATVVLAVVALISKLRTSFREKTLSGKKLQSSTDGRIFSGGMQELPISPSKMLSLAQS